MPDLLLVVYCVLIVTASLLGGWLPFLMQLTHRRMQLLMSFVGGLMLGVALLHLIPHALAEAKSVQLSDSHRDSDSHSDADSDNHSDSSSDSHSDSDIDRVVYAVVAGVLLTFFMIRLFHVHQHGHEVGDGHEHHADTCDHGPHEHAHPTGAPVAGEPHVHPHTHPHAHAQSHGHAHHGHDHNFSAAYIHVMADAFTSVLAIAALAGGVWFGLAWLDPAVALLGAVVIGQWSFGVLRSTARALVDATEDPALAQRVRDLIEADGDAKVADLHVWQVGARAWCAALSVVADAPLPAADYRQRLATMDTLRHVTVEVHRCVGGTSHA